MNDHLWMGLYRLTYYMLTTLPEFDTLEGEERQQMVQMKAALVQFIRVTEDKYKLTHTVRTKAERRRIPSG